MKQIASHIYALVLTLCMSTHCFDFTSWKKTPEKIYKDSFLCNQKTITIYRKGIISITKIMANDHEYYNICNLDEETVHEIMYTKDTQKLFIFLHELYTQQTMVQKQESNSL